MKRYQDCNFIIKLWRMRWYICVPFYTAWLWITDEPIIDDDTNVSEKMPFSLCWTCAVGHFQVSKMEFYYTTEEVFERIHNRLK